MFVVNGVTTCVAARFRYGGGLRSFLGLLCITAAIARLAFAWQIDLQGRRLPSPAIFYTTTAFTWGLGCYCLIWGHMRHRRAKQNSLGNVVSQNRMPP
jgi:hypothetical protein